MSLLYRAMWQADADGLVQAADREFRQWTTGNHPRLDLESSDEAEHGSVDAKVEHRPHDLGSISRLVVHEDTASARWITTLRVLTERDAAEGWIWIDIECVSAVYYKRPKISAPRLAGALLESLPTSHRGPMKLQRREFMLGSDAMSAFAELLVSPDRDLPLVVFSPEYGTDQRFTIDRAKRAASTLAGLAQVHLLVPEGEAEFRDLMGRDLGVWSGACRVYMPGIDLENPVPWHHRYFLSRGLGTNAHDAGLVVARFLSPRMARQRAPQIYAKLRGLLSKDLARENDDLWSHVEDLEEDLERTQESYLSAAAHGEDLTEQLGRALQRVDQSWAENRRLWAAIGAAEVQSQVEAELSTQSGAEELPLPDPPERSVDVPAFAARHLRWVVVHEDACEELERLDEQNDSRNWAGAAWNALVALDKYAQEADGFEGDFEAWCERSDSPFAWRPHKVAMHESNEVKTTPKYRNPRIRPVDADVHPDGKMFMEAHIKVVLGGGMSIPRIYFVDDTRHKTKKIHIGFFGPHDLVPNPSAN
ncbi:MAG: hypothetical protein F4190_02170 [Acidimicrobiales bacterium]|nr:hypothetical protein [Acidimicrobiales bacterium]MYI28060.1 hypothetical protein [Acidimicrobiales bacterium]